MEPNTNNLIEIQNLVKNFGQIRAVDRLNLTVEKGEVFGLLGHNGAGKSTAMRMMLSLIEPSSGTILFSGRNLKDHRNDILKSVGCIIEKPDFYPWLSARTNLEMFARMTKTNISKLRINEILEFVGLDNRGKDKINTFSHGMKQRLGLAQAIVHKPSLIIIDEPSTGLDPKGIIELRSLIRSLSKDLGVTVLLSSHMLNEIELVADSMAIMEKGKSIVQGKVENLLNSEDLLVEFNVSDPQKASRIALENNLKLGIVVENILSVGLSKSQVPGLIRIFMDNGVDVFQVESKRRLEDYFMKMTGQIS